MESNLKTSYMRFVGEVNELLATTGCNCVYSPLSIYVALSMLEMISRDDSVEKNSLAEALGLGNNTLNELLDTLEKLQDESFTSANCVGIAPVVLDFVNDECLGQLKKKFAVEVFYKNDFIRKINRFIKKVTKGMLDNVVPNDSSLSFVLANAVCFADKWKEPYKASQIDKYGVFTNYLGEEESVVMMDSEEKYGIKGSQFTGLCKSYKNGNYDFMALLPDDEKTDIVEFFNEYAGRLMEIYEKKKRIKVYAKIPCFKVESSFELKNVLKVMGIDLLASDNFLKLFDGCSNTVDSILHKALIKVDESGTKAAAATVIMMKGAIMPFREESLEVCLDRPFIYAIMSKTTGLPVFVGLYSIVGEAN